MQIELGAKYTVGGRFPTSRWRISRLRGVCVHPAGKKPARARRHVFANGPEMPARIAQALQRWRLAVNYASHESKPFVSELGLGAGHAAAAGPSADPVAATDRLHQRSG